MMGNEYLKENISKLKLDNDTIKVLNTNGLFVIDDLWNCSNKKLQDIGLTNYEINQIRIEMQLHGIDLNKKSYNNNSINRN